jgi:hypothetical protein
VIQIFKLRIGKLSDFRTLKTVLSLLVVEDFRTLKTVLSLLVVEEFSSTGGKILTNFLI